jgi:hypothetical protein
MTHRRRSLSFVLVRPDVHQATNGIDHVTCGSLHDLAAPPRDAELAADALVVREVTWCVGAG